MFVDTHIYFRSSHVLTNPSYIGSLGVRVWQRSRKKEGWRGWSVPEQSTQLVTQTWGWLAGCIERKRSSLSGSDAAVHRDSMINEAGKLQEAINQYRPFILSFKVDTPIHVFLSYLILKMMEGTPWANTLIWLNLPSGQVLASSHCWIQSAKATKTIEVTLREVGVRITWNNIVKTSLLCSQTMVWETTERLISGCKHECALIPSKHSS